MQELEMTAFYATTGGGINLYLSRTFCCDQSLLKA